MRVKLSYLLITLASYNLTYAASSNDLSIELNLKTISTPPQDIRCQDNNCTWSNNASANIQAGESDNDFCHGIDSKIDGIGHELAANSYNMELPTGIAKPINGRDSDVILELFNTPYRNITKQMLKEYAKLGYNTIWISPPQKNAYVPYWKKTIPAWYGAYQPLDFGQIGDKQNVMSFGSAQELADLVNRTHKLGLKMIVDLAIHQFAQPGVNGTHFYSEYAGEKYNFESSNMSAIQTMWWPQTKVTGYIPFNYNQQCAADTSHDTATTIALVGNNPNGKIFNKNVAESAQWQDDLSGLNGWFDGVLPAASNSSLGVTKISCRTHQVFDGFAAWLMGANYAKGNVHLKATTQTGFNVDGFRIDDISGQSVEFYQQLFTDTAKYNHDSNLFFGEYPTQSANDYVKYTAINTVNGNSSSDHHMKMLNFPLLVTLKQAFNSNQLQATLQKTINAQYAYNESGVLTGNQAINLVIDQDTAPDSISSRAMCPWDGKPQKPDYVMNYYIAPLAYGVILAMQAGTPYVFADLQAANKVGISEKGKFVSDVANGSVSYWNQNEVIAGVYFHNQTLGQEMHWGHANNATDDGVATFTRGDSYLFILNNSQNSYSANNSPAALNDGEYIDLMSHQIISVKSHKLAYIFVPQKAVMYFVPVQSR